MASLGIMNDSCIWMRNNWLTYIGGFLFFLCACGEVRKGEALVVPEAPVLEQVLNRGALRVCSYYNTTDYYVYKGVVKGFHYELVKDFADYLGVRLEMTASVDVEESIRLLAAGEFDLLAMGLTETPERDSLVAFTIPLFSTTMALVQNKNDKPLARRVEDLRGQEVFVQQGTSYAGFLRDLNDASRAEVRLVEMDSLTYEDILLAVEHGELPRTVVEANIARTAARYMPHLDDSLTLSMPIPVAWAVRKGEEGLLYELNAWLAEVKRREAFHVRYNRYFKSSYVTSLRNSKYYKLKHGVISSFDPVIKREAGAIGWDWRLLAAVIYQESLFDPEAESSFGAYGLMQVMPETAEEMGCPDRANPADNIRAGCRYLRKLQHEFDKFGLDSVNSLKFALAAYNAGTGHVLDAIRLAEAYGYDPRVWMRNVEYCVLALTYPEFYRDTLCRNGYCDGRQTFNFVNEIFENYRHYCNSIPDGASL